MQLKKLFARKKNSLRASRVNEFMLESLEPRLLLSATPMTAAVVTTDHLDYAPGETAVIALDLAGIAVATGSACASGKVAPSHVLKAMALADDHARSALRVSLGWATTREDIDKFIAAFAAHRNRIAGRAAA